MGLLFGSYSLQFLGASILIAALTYLTYKLLSSYLHKWFEMKSIPGTGLTYPIIGDALLFKTNAGGKNMQEHAQHARGTCHEMKS